MRLPKQVKPVMRTVSTAGIKDGVNPSLFGFNFCDLLQDPKAREVCHNVGRVIETER
jgi:hypothetical protein